MAPGTISQPHAQAQEMTQPVRFSVRSRVSRCIPGASVCVAVVRSTERNARMHTVHDDHRLVKPMEKSEHRSGIRAECAMRVVNGVHRRHSVAQHLPYLCTADSSHPPTYKIQGEASAGVVGQLVTE